MGLILDCDSYSSAVAVLYSQLSFWASEARTPISHSILWPSISLLNIQPCRSLLWGPIEFSYDAGVSQSLASNIQGTPMSPTPAFCIASFSLVPWSSNFSNFSSSEHQTQMNTLAKWNQCPLLWPLLPIWISVYLVYFPPSEDPTYTVFQCLKSVAIELCPVLYVAYCGTVNCDSYSIMVEKEADIQS